MANLQVWGRSSRNLGAHLTYVIWLDYCHLGRQLASVPLAVVIGLSKRAHTTQPPPTWPLHQKAACCCCCWSTNDAKLSIRRRSTSYSLRVLNSISGSGTINRLIESSNQNNNNNNNNLALERVRARSSLASDDTPSRVVSPTRFGEK